MSPPTDESDINIKPKSKSKPNSNSNSKTPSLPAPTQSFSAKKARILSAIAVPAESYTDKSPKGSIDVPILELICELNALDGVVTTSSCSGRVAVFVEGPQTSPFDLPSKRRGDGDDDDDDDGSGRGEDEEEEQEILTGSPAGKGGGHWLYVSHDPVSIPLEPKSGFFTKLCSLSPLSTSTERPSSEKMVSPRLIKLSFSPLILHIHCSSLQHARLLLVAAINAGFRESGVQSLRVLDDADAGVTLGIRTAGLAFESVIGIVVRGDNNNKDNNNDHRYESVVSEEDLRRLFTVVNERFEWNVRRKERLRREIRTAFATAALGHNGEDGQEWEDAEVRRRRKREEGLKRQQDRKREGDEKKRTGEAGESGEDEVLLVFGENEQRQWV